MFDIDSLKRQPATLFTAIDLSAGNKAATEVQQGVLIVARIVARYSNAWGVEFGWLLSLVRDGSGGGPRPFETSTQLGDELMQYGIDYMEDKVWLPL